jgi:KaiC protein
VKRLGRLVAVPSDSDLSLAREDALLQLRIGRNAHFISIGVSAALLVDGFLVSTFASYVTPFEPTWLQGVLFLAFPVVAALYLSLFALREKWEEFTMWPWQGHFALTIASVAFSLGLAAVYFGNLLHFGPMGHWGLVPWFYPLALLGVTAPMTSLALTWPAWGRRKLLAVITALLPLVFALGLYVPASGLGTGAAALGLTLIVSGFLYQTSGSFLHLISSGTEVHEREVVTSGQSKVYALAEELQRKEDALQFRESTLVRREADVEDSETALARRLEAFDVTRKQFEAHANEIRGQSDALTETERKTALAASEVAAQHRALENREAALKVRENEIGQMKQRLSDQQEAVGRQESAVVQRAVETDAKARTIADREQAAADTEARAAARLKEVEQKTADLLKREADLRTREVAPRGAAGKGADAASKAERDRLAAQAQDLAARNAELLHRQAKLDQLDKTLAQRAKESESIRQELRIADGKRVEAERALQKREALFAQREAELAQLTDSANNRRGQYDEVVKKYEERAKAVAQQEAEATARVNEAKRILSAVGGREKAVAEHESKLASDRAELDRRHREFIERERAMDAREAELALKQQEAGRRVTATAGAMVPVSSDREKALDIREKQLREKETELTKLAYDLAHPPSAGEGTLAAPPTRRLADRAPTGTPRLDDLLLGGIPPRGHVMLAGPPFVGKEVALYAFIAEGLKRGETAILLTTAKTPQELAQEIGLVSPQFREYEHMGRVVWIDASDPSAAPSMTEKGALKAVVKGPSDYEGILKALVKASQKAEEKGSSGARVGVLGLAACIAQGDERAGFGFLQNFVGIVKPRKALGMYLVDRGALSDGQVETIQARMDGALLFKQERGKTFLSVQGMGEVATRDWVEYRATNRSLVIGSFSLERIR